MMQLYPNSLGTHVYMYMSQNAPLIGYQKIISRGERVHILLEGAQPQAIGVSLS